MSDDPNKPVLEAIAALAERMDRLEAGQTDLRVQVMARMDRLQDALGAIREDIGKMRGEP